MVPTWTKKISKEKEDYYKYLDLPLNFVSISN